MKRMLNMSNIDVVLLWVDSQDEEWQKTYNAHSPVEITTANHSCRFRSWDNLEYIFRGIELFMPWVKTIHFVTQGHLPSWLNTRAKNLNIVKHDDIFEDHSHLPTFNSNAIEVNFNKIDSLSECFILFNDDFFILNKLPQERFFVDNLPVDFLVQGFKRSGPLYKLIKPQNSFNAKAINNNIDYINSNYKKNQLNSECYFSNNYSLGSKISNFIYNVVSNRVPWLKLNHVPQPHLKSTFDKIWALKPNLLSSTSSHRFRSEADTTQYLFRYINLISGAFYPHEYCDYLSREINSSSDLKEILKGLTNINLLSVSDTQKLNDSEFNNCKSIMKEYLNIILPEKSTFEI